MVPATSANAPWGRRYIARIATAPPEPAFRIDVRFLGGLSDTQRAAFETAAGRWEQILSADVPSVVIRGETIDDVRIDAAGERIDGPGRILGSAGPVDLRPGSFIPATGLMSFDSADLARMESDGSLVTVIVHEMGHVLGFGTLFPRRRLVIGFGGPDPQFIGENAAREYAALRGPGARPRSVPLANVGGPGTRDGHWREAVFANELMTGLHNAGANPISRVTIGAFEDLGYSVDYTAADEYRLPTATELLTLKRARAERGHACMIEIPEQTVLPDSAIVH